MSTTVSALQRIKLSDGSYAVVLPINTTDEVFVDIDGNKNLTDELLKFVRLTGGTMTGALQVPELLVGPKAAQKYIGVCPWTQAVANQKFDILLPNRSYGGTFKITLASGFNNSNASGIIEKAFNIITNSSSGVIHTQDSMYSYVGGNIRNAVAISDLKWDATLSCYKITVANLDNAGNNCWIMMDYISSGDSAPNMTGITISPVYTTDSTVYTKADLQTYSGNKIWHQGNDGPGSGLAADTATKLETTRLISLNGDATGSVSFNGTSDVGITVTVVDDGHAHTEVAVKPDNYRDGLSLPSTFPRGTSTFFSNNPANTFNSTPYCTIVTIKGFSGVNCTQYIYPYNVDGPIIYRNVQYPSDVWLPWKTISTTDHNHNAVYLALTGGSMTGLLTLSGDPTNPLHAATKQYVDNLVQGLDVKLSVRVATTANITLSGLQAIDGVTVVAGDRVLVKDQTTATQNGLYLASASAWTRTLDFDDNPGTEVEGGEFVFVTEGTVNSDSGWVVVTNGPITIGTNAINFSQFSGAGQISAGAGIAKSGNILSLASGVVTAGTYTKVTVDTYGRVTTGTTLSATDIPVLDWTKITTGKPTTLSGYGITDAVNTSEVVATATANKILKLNALGQFPADITGNAATASKLGTARSIGLTGDASGSTTFDGLTNASITVTHANSGVTAGTYTKVTVDSKGRVTVGNTLGSSDIPSLDWTKITTGRPTTLSGYGITDGVNTSDVATTATANKILKLNASAQLPADITGNAASATKLQTSRTISLTGDATGSVAFDGTANAGITVTHANSGVTAGTYTKVTVDAKGRVTVGTSLSASDIPVLDWAKITTGKPTTLSGYGITDGLNKTGDTMTGSLTLNADPTNALHAATKQYVDNLIQGLDIKPSVRIATTANIALTGLQFIDGVTTANNDRVLVKNQTVASQNGIYLASAAGWTRAIDFDDSPGTEVEGGEFVFVTEGSSNADSGWVVVTNGPITVGTNDINFSQFSGAGQITAGTGLSKSGNTISMTNTGVSAGTYTKVTIDLQGRVTSATTLATTDIPVLDWTKITTGKPTTLSGYGITDAVNTSEVVSAVAANKILRLNASSQLPADITGNSATASKLATARTISLNGDASGSTSFDGSGNAAITVTVADDSHEHTMLKKTDNRTIKPNGTLAGMMIPYFTSIGGLNGTQDSAYADLLVLNLYHDPSGGSVNALVFDKAQKRILHYQALQTDNVWGTPKTIAYAEDLASAAVLTATKLATPRTIALNGDVTGNVEFDGTAGVSIYTTVADDSHAHTEVFVKPENYRDSLSLPSTFPRGTITFFSNDQLNKFNGLQFCTVVTVKGYPGLCCTQFLYQYHVDSPIYYRNVAYPSDAWLPWKAIATTDHNHDATYLALTGGTLTGNLTLAADPTNPLHAATKQYVDNVVQGLDVKQSVRVATTANITLSGVQTIDGITLVAWDRVLVKNQTNGTENGIYTVASGAWVRATDSNSSVKVTPGLFVYVEQGTVNSDSGWVLATDGVIVIGTTSISFTQFSGAGQISAGTGITKSGNTLSLTSGVGPVGTYTKITVDTYGRVTNATNATTDDMLYPPDSKSVTLKIQEMNNALDSIKIRNIMGVY